MKNIWAFLILAFAFAVHGEERWLHDIDNGGEKLGAWSVPAPWGGTLTTVKDGYGGNPSPEIRTTKYQNRFLGRGFRRISDSTPVWGRKFEYSILVRGKGEFEVGTVAIGARDAVPYNSLTPLKKFSLSPDKWLECKTEIINTDPALWQFGVLAIVSGEDSYVQLGPDKLQWIEPKHVITAVPSHVVTYPGVSPEVAFRYPGGADTLQGFDGKTKKVLQSSNGEFLLKAADGIAPLGEKDPATWIPGTGRIGVWDPAEGAAANVFISRIPKKEWEEIDGNAQKIKLARPLRILYLGDSLSDYDRGRNYTDKVDYWLNLHNPGQASFRNAGVGGDTIESLYNRLTGGKYTWRQYMYEGLFGQPYDYIFIFLGHNDTRRHYSPKTGSYQPVEPDKQQKMLSATIEFLRSKTPAKIVLITPASSDYPQCLKAAEPAKKAGQPYVIFGEPERLDKYCEVLRGAASEFKVGLLDLYTPMKTLPEKETCFTKPDGVHLTSRGNNYIAARIIEYLAKEKQK